MQSARLLDTRVGLGAARGPVAARQTVVVATIGHDGLPATNVSAVRLTLTVADPTRAGRIFFSHGRHAGKRISSVSFRPKRTVSKVGCASASTASTARTAARALPVPNAQAGARPAQLPSQIAKSRTPAGHPSDPRTQNR